MNLGFWWYAGFVASAALICSPWILLKLEERQDRIDREVWDEMRRWHP